MFITPRLQSISQRDEIRSTEKLGKSLNNQSYSKNIDKVHRKKSVNTSDCKVLSRTIKRIITSESRDLKGFESVDVKHISGMEKKNRQKCVIDDVPKSKSNSELVEEPHTKHKKVLDPNIHKSLESDCLLKSGIKSRPLKKALKTPSLKVKSEEYYAEDVSKAANSCKKTKLTNTIIQKNENDSAPLSIRGATLIGKVNVVHKPSDVVQIKTKKPYTQNFNQILPKTASMHTRLAHNLRLAVHEGGSFDPKKNTQLKRAIKLALDEKLTLGFIENTIQKCVDPDSGKNTQLLQLRFQKIVCMICIVNTEHLNDIKRQLAPLFKQYGAAVTQTIHMFNSSGIVEAIVPFQTAVNFEDLEGTIARDAMSCHAKDIEIVDYETGAVNFNCSALELPEVCRAVQKKGYTVMHTEYIIRPKSTIELDVPNCRKYKRFLEKLFKVPEIVSIHDNVKKLEQDTNEAKD